MNELAISAMNLSSIEHPWETFVRNIVVNTSDLFCPLQFAAQPRRYGASIAGVQRLAPSLIVTLKICPVITEARSNCRTDICRCFCAWCQARRTYTPNCATVTPHRLIWAGCCHVFIYRSVIADKPADLPRLAKPPLPGPGVNRSSSSVGRQPATLPPAVSY